MKQGWEIKKIKDICCKASSNIAQNKITELDGEYPVYGASGFVQNIDYFHRDTDYIGIVKDGSGVGRVNVYPAYSSLLGTMQYILPNDGYSLNFIAYALKSLNLAKFASGAAIPHIYFKDYGEVSIPIPSLAEQEHIVQELDLLSGVIEKKRQQLKELDNLAQSIFYDMFGDPVGNDKGWNIVKFADGCVEIGDGLHGTPNYDVEGTIPFINGTNLIDGRIIVTDRTLFVNETEAMKYRVKMDTNTVLLSINGTLGKTAIYQDENVILGKSACFCRLKKEYFNVVFVERLMNTDYFKKFLEENSSKSTIKNVGLKTIRNYKIVVPSLFLQQEFAEKIEAIEKQKELIKQSLVETETLFNSRMEYYFN